MITRFIVGLLISFSAYATAQTVAEAWASSPSSCDTQCAMNGVATVTGSQSGSGAWTQVYSGSTVGTVAIPTGAQFIAVNGTVYTPNTSYSEVVDKTVTQTTCGTSNPQQTFTTSCTWTLNSTSVTGCRKTITGCNALQITAEQVITSVWIYK